ncbi:hypothetical protein Tco_1306829 [Tanacetum coccineum]
MPAACPEAMNQGTADLDHLKGKIRKERLCSEGWKRVYFTGWVIKKRGGRMSESEDSAGEHWKSKSKKQRSSMEDEDLSQPWVCEETDPFTPRIRYFDLPKRIRMPSQVKTYDESEDPEDHLKIFQAAAKQKKCIKDPVKIHHIKQREGESTEDFVRRFKTESRDVKGAPKVMRISGFMHGITNSELIKRLHDKIPKSVDEMWKITTAFLRGEVAAGN